MGVGLGQEGQGILHPTESFGIGRPVERPDRPAPEPHSCQETTVFERDLWIARVVLDSGSEGLERWSELTLLDQISGERSMIGRTLACEQATAN